MIRPVIEVQCDCCKSRHYITDEDVVSGVIEGISIESDNNSNVYEWVYPADVINVKSLGLNWTHIAEEGFGDLCEECFNEIKNLYGRMRR